MTSIELLPAGTMYRDLFGYPGVGVLGLGESLLLDDSLNVGDHRLLNLLLRRRVVFHVLCDLGLMRRDVS